MSLAVWFHPDTLGKLGEGRRKKERARRQRKGESGGKCRRGRKREEGK